MTHMLDSQQYSCIKDVGMKRQGLIWQKQKFVYFKEFSV